ncbi:MAG: efflux RND transporter periplasmic adaptor subunit [Bacteroidota bacterium]
MAKKKGSATKRLLIAFGVIVALLIVVGGVGSQAGWFGGGPEGTTVEVDTVDERDITQVVVASGRVQPEVEVQISPDVSGEIITLPVLEGDRVSKGDLLVRIDPDFYRAQLEQSEAGVLQAKASLAQRRADMLNAELEMNRTRTLFEKNAVPQSDLERAQTTYEVQKAGFEAAGYSVQSAEARQREAVENLSRTTIYAPMDGTISQLNVELGERALGTVQMQGTVLMTLAKLNQMEIMVDVNENDVVNVALGDTAAIEVDAYPERIFKGVVTEIANSARTQGAGTQEQVTNFPVKVRILDRHNVEVATLAEGLGSDEAISPNDEMPIFRPGMSGTVDIFTRTDVNTLAVPIQAVTVRDYNKVKSEADSTSTPVQAASTTEGEDLRKVVFIVEDGKTKMVEVETGISDDTHIVVTGRLAVGDQVVTGPFRAVSRELRPDQDVQVREEGAAGREGNRFESR